MSSHGGIFIGDRGYLGRDSLKVDVENVPFKDGPLLRVVDSTLLEGHCFFSR